VQRMPIILQGCARARRCPCPQRATSLYTTWDRPSHTLCCATIRCVCVSLCMWACEIVLVFTGLRVCYLRALDGP
jgi:hypothetical protein